MATTTITGTINGVNNTALANKWITFRLVQLGTDSGATATVAQSVDSVQTDANGDFSIDVWTNGDSGKPSVLEITIDGSKPESVIIPTGTATIELWDLIENYQADGSTSEQVPVVSDLFLRKSTNLSDLGDAPTSRTNLGVEIGTDVQAHSATLDATTASFTTADETKLDGIEALADVTDATNIAANGGYVAGGTDVALTDGGTGASDATTARTNLGFRDNVSSAVTAVGVTPYTVLSTDEILTVDDTAIGGNVTINLPSAATLGSGWSLTVKRTGITYLVTIDPNGTETIDGALTLPLTSKDEAISIVSDGTNWEIVGSQSSKLDSVIYVKEASDLAGVLVSDKVYQIDGIIDMGSQSIDVPPGGLSLIGTTFDVCQLISSADGYTMFTSPVGGSGNLLSKDLGFTVSGAGSQVFDLVSATGFDAFEFARINFNNCSSLGTVDNYRQGLEEGSGRFGGSPSLTLKGAWLGGYRITTSIVRSLAGTMTAPLFSAGTGFVMQSRFLTDINCDLPTLAAFCDFSPTNFPNPSTLQIQGAIITRDGANSANDANITPNVGATDLCSAWRDNVGLKNTFVGGVSALAIEAETVISAINTASVIAGTWVPYDLVHFDSPANGQLRHTGNDPRQFRVTFDFVVEGTSGDSYEIRLIKDDGAQTLVFSQTRVVNNLQGARDVAYYDATTYVELNQNDIVFWEIVNTSSAANCTLEDGSQFNVEAR